MNDTCLGINNEGRLIFDYYHEDTDYVGQLPVYTGQNSVLWNNFREAFADEIQETYQDLRNNGKITYDKIVEQFIDKGSRQWSASIYNEDSDYKYISMCRSDNDATYLYQVRGNGEGHLKYFVSNRLKYLDSKWQASDFINNIITLRINTPSGDLAVPANASIKITPFSNMYAGVKYTANSPMRQQKVEKNVQAVFLPDADDTFTGIETYIYGASEISSLDDLAPMYCSLVDVSKATRLVNIKIGDNTEGYVNENLTDLSVGTNKLLKTLDIRNCPNLKKPLALSGCPNIEEIYATGSGITGLELADGSGYLKVLHLPSTITDLTLKNQLYISDFMLEGYDNLVSINIENCPAINELDLLANSTNLQRVRLINVTWTLEDAKHIVSLIDKRVGGIDENGYNTITPMISGTCRVAYITYNELKKILANLPYLTITYDYMEPPTSRNLVDGTINSISNNLVTNVGDYSLFAKALTTVDLPEATNVSTNGFGNVSRLSNVNLPKVETIGAGAFYGCMSLPQIDLPKVARIDSNAFARCYSLTTVILRSKTVCTLVNANVFEFCYRIVGTQDNKYNPEGLKDGYIYVPKSLIEDYKVATNWSTYATQFRAIEDYPEICGGE